MQKYAFSIDDGAHTEQLEVFTSLEEATKYYENEVKKAEKDPEKYFNQSASEWSDDFYPHIELTKVDEDEYYEDDIDSWAPDY